MCPGLRMMFPHARKDLRCFPDKCSRTKTLCSSTIEALSLLFCEKLSVLLNSLSSSETLLTLQSLLKGRQTGGFPDLDSSFLFLSFLGLLPIFRDFPDFSRDSSGIFPIGPFPLSLPINSTYEEQSRKGRRHNLDLPRKKWETPRFGNPPV